MNMALKKQFAQQYANTYVETSVSEASPHKLVEMLYDSALKNLGIAKVFIEQKDYAKKSVFLNKALSIISALRAGVDMEKGGEVAVNLYALYDYCYRQTFEASVKNDAAIVDEVIELISEISDAWKQMPNNIKSVSKEQLDNMSVS